MTKVRSGAALRGFAVMEVNKQREIARKGGAKSLMKSEASRRIEPSPPMRDEKVGLP